MATLDSTGAVQATANYAPFGEPQGSSIAPFGFTGELQDQGLVNLRARWYDPSSGVFTAVDPFSGFPETPYSLHPYQYAYANPVLWTDPTGECIPEGIPGLGEPGCEFIGWDGVEQGELNWADGQQYVQTAIVEPVTQLVSPTWNVIIDAPGSREEVVQGAEYLVTHPIESGGIIVESAIAPFTDIYYGIICHDPNQLGRGLTGYALLAGGARLMRGRSAPVQPTTLATLRRLAQQADRTTPIPPGTPAHVAGTLKHATFARLVQRLGRPNLTTEVNYLGGRVLNRNVRGSVRLDVVEGPLNAPTAVYDLKTGASGLSAARIRQIRGHLPGGGMTPSGHPVPIIEVRP